jgi:hypothetical protein
MEPIRIGHHGLSVSPSEKVPAPVSGVSPVTRRVFERPR